MRVFKGPEYRIAEAKLQIPVEGNVEHGIALTRWSDMPARGWYSGDAHVHISRDPSDNERIAAYLRAEDVHVTNLLEMSNGGDAHFHQYAFGLAGSVGIA